MKKLLTVLALLSSFAVSAGDDGLKLHIDYLGFSYHHIEDPEVNNEEHHGFGFSLVEPSNNARFGFIRYKNSYSDMSNLLWGSVEVGSYKDVSFDIGGGLVSGYGDKLALGPVLGWATARYKWFYVNHIPTQVTAIGLSIPLGEIL